MIRPLNFAVDPLSPIARVPVKLSFGVPLVPACEVIDMAEIKISEGRTLLSKRTILGAVAPNGEEAC